MRRTCGIVYACRTLCTATECMRLGCRPIMYRLRGSRGEVAKTTTDIGVLSLEAKGKTRRAAELGQGATRRTRKTKLRVASGGMWPVRLRLEDNLERACLCSRCISLQAN